MFKNILLVAFALLIGANVNAQTQGKRAGFDLIGIGSGYQYAVGNIFGPWTGAHYMSMEDRCAVPRSSCSVTPVTEVVAVPYSPFNSNVKKVKVSKVSVVYYSDGNTMDLNLVQGWQIDIWSSLNSLISNPWIGNVSSEVMLQPTGGDTTTPIQTLTFGDKYFLEFDIQDVVMDRRVLKSIGGSNGTVYIGVRAINDSSVNGWGGLAESSFDSPQFTGIYSSYGFPYGNPLYWTDTMAFGFSSVSTYGNPAYAVEAYRCLNQIYGAPC